MGYKHIGNNIAVDNFVGLIDERREAEAEEHLSQQCREVFKNSLCNSLHHVPVQRCVDRFTGDMRAASEPLLQRLLNPNMVVCVRNAFCFAG